MSTNSIKMKFKMPTLPFKSNFIIFTVVVLTMLFLFACYSSTTLESYQGSVGKYCGSKCIKKCSTGGWYYFPSLESSYGPANWCNEGNGSVIVDNRTAEQLTIDLGLDGGGQQGGRRRESMQGGMGGMQGRGQMQRKRRRMGGQQMGGQRMGGQQYR